MAVGVILKTASKSKPVKKLIGKGTAAFGILRGTAGLAVPIIGGAMGLIGGAMGLAGGILNAGSTITGIAADAAGGVFNAVGGLGGKGKSGNTSNSTELQTIGATMNKKGASGKGFPLANVKSMLSTTTPEGAMSPLPTGSEGPMGMLSGMLQQIAINTSPLLSIDAKMDALIGAFNSSPSDLIDDAKDTKEGNGNQKEPGVVKRTFSALGDKLKSITGGLGGVAKNILKGIGLAGLFVLFTKYRKNLVGAVSAIFETLDGWYDALQSGENPITDMFDNVKTYFNNEVLPTLKEMTVGFLKMLFNTIRTVANSVLPDWAQIPDLFGEAATIPTKYDTSTDQRLSGFAFGLGPDNLGGVRASINPLDDALVFEGGSASDNLGLQQAVADKLQIMYDYFQGSGGRIQWTGIGEGFTLGGGIDSFYKSGGRVDIAGIMTSKPIVDGYDRTIADLDNPNLLATPFGDDDSTFKTAFMANLVKMTDLKQNSKLNGTIFTKAGAEGDIIGAYQTSYGASAGGQLNTLESETRAILAAAGVYDSQSVLIGGASNTNINSKTENHVQSSILSTDMNLSTFHFGDALKPL